MLFHSHSGSPMPYCTVVRFVFCRFSFYDARLVSAAVRWLQVGDRFVFCVWHQLSQAFPLGCGPEQCILSASLLCLFLSRVSFVFWDFHVNKSFMFLYIWIPALHLIYPFRTRHGDRWTDHVRHSRNPSSFDFSTLVQFIFSSPCFFKVPPSLTNSPKIFLGEAITM